MAHRNRWFTVPIKNCDFPWQTVSHNQRVDLMFPLSSSPIWRGPLDLFRLRHRYRQHGPLWYHASGGLWLRLLRQPPVTWTWMKGVRKSRKSPHPMLPFQQSTDVWYGILIVSMVPSNIQSSKLQYPIVSGTLNGSPTYWSSLQTLFMADPDSKCLRLWRMNIFFCTWWLQQTTPFFRYPFDSICI